MKVLVVLFITFFDNAVHAQTDTIVDIRDGQKYSTVVIGNKIWFREHLRYKTKLSYCSILSKNTNECTKGNYYLNQEIDSICPKGWHVTTIDEWENYINILLRKSGISKDSLKIGQFTIPKTIIAAAQKNINILEDSALNLIPRGWVEGKKIMHIKGLNLWIVDKRTNDKKYHLHGGELGYAIHSHTHHIIDKPRRIRMFNVRCVCDLKDK